MEEIQILNNRGSLQKYAYFPSINRIVRLSDEAVRFLGGEDNPEVAKEYKLLLKQRKRTIGSNSLYLNQIDLFERAAFNDDNKRVQIFLDLSREPISEETILRVNSIVSHTSNKVFVITSYNGNLLNDSLVAFKNQIIRIQPSDYVRLVSGKDSIKNPLIFEIEIDSDTVLESLLRVSVPGPVGLILKIKTPILFKKLLSFYKSDSLMENCFDSKKIINFRLWNQFKLNTSYSDQVKIIDEAEETPLSVLNHCDKCFSKQFCWRTMSYLFYSDTVREANCNMIRRVFKMFLSSAANSIMIDSHAPKESIIQFNKDSFDIQLINP